jgi:hypothetical protein
MAALTAFCPKGQVAMQAGVGMAGLAVWEKVRIE